MDLTSILVSGAKLLGSKFIKDNLGSFNIRELLKKEQARVRNDGDLLTLEKLQVISPFASFCALPDFEVDNPTMNISLVVPFYNAAKRLVYDLKYTSDEFNYCKRNYMVNDVSDKLELLDYLSMERDNITRNDSRYYMGFRSFYFALRQNLNKIDLEYIAGINKILTPFYLSYKHKELFIPGLEFVDK